jgi:hypothetical protein
MRNLNDRRRRWGIVLAGGDGVRPTAIRIGFRVWRPVCAARQLAAHA